MIRIVTGGKNPTLRCLSRTHGVSVAWLFEVFEPGARDDVILVYETSARMCADIYTKAFTDATKWKAAQ